MPVRLIGCLSLSRMPTPFVVQAARLPNDSSGNSCCSFPTPDQPVSSRRVGLLVGWVERKRDPPGAATPVGLAYARPTLRLPIIQSKQDSGSVRQAHGRVGAVFDHHEIQGSPGNAGRAVAAVG